MISLCLFLFSIFPWVKKIWVSKFLSPKKFWIKKNLGPKNLFLCPTKILSQKIYVKNFWTKQISGTRKLKVNQKYWVQKSLGPKIFFCPKALFTLEKYFGSVKNFGPKIFLDSKNLGQTNFWVQKVVYTI